MVQKKVREFISMLKLWLCISWTFEYFKQILLKRQKSKQNEKNANSPPNISDAVDSYLKTYKRHWVLSSPGSMWTERHTKSTTAYLNDIDVFALLLSASNHSYSCDDDLTLKHCQTIKHQQTKPQIRFYQMERYAKKPKRKLHFRIQTQVRQVKMIQLFFFLCDKLNHAHRSHFVRSVCIVRHNNIWLISIHLFTEASHSFVSELMLRYLHFQTKSKSVSLK